LKSSGVRKHDLESMPEQLFDDWLVSNLDICQCLDCATHNECAKKTGERLFCAVMRSPMCIETKRGCLCPECTIAKELGFMNTYHCLNGAEIERGN
jgi:hypothetical protein